MQGFLIKFLMLNSYGGYPKKIAVVVVAVTFWLQCSNNFIAPSYISEFNNVQNSTTQDEFESILELKGVPMS